ncbi:MAG: ATP-binding cassette domain-containing protein, partial [Anaerolineaceae bacterium]
DVHFAYEEGTQALEDISFDVKPGQVVALLGSTGSGKSTLVNLLPRFFEYTSGSITLDGVELNRYPRQFLRQNIGFVEQEPFLFSRSIRENITYGVGKDIPQADVEQAAKAAAIHEVILSVLGGYAIARALLKNPRILILDDSTSSVDTETEGIIREALKNLMKGRTTFIIAHRIQTIMSADLILVLDKGRVVQKGTHAELIHQDGIYRRIHAIQSQIDEELEKEISRV